MRVYRIADGRHPIWDGTGANPYFAFLHHADHVLVTEDSANMAAEAASTAKPVHPASPSHAHFSNSTKIFAPS